MDRCRETDTIRSPLTVLVEPIFVDYVSVQRALPHTARIFALLIESGGEFVGAKDEQY